MSIELINYRANYARVDLGDLSIYFSYDVPVAFSHGTPSIRTVRENLWGARTGEHIDNIDGGGAEARSQRVSSDEFGDALRRALTDWNA